jgi:hypothetical protein
MLIWEWLLRQLAEYVTQRKVENAFLPKKQAMEMSGYGKHGKP